MSGDVSSAPWVPVTSSNVAAVRHAGTDLEVRFARGGVVYRYNGVPESIYKDMLAAPSKGKFVWQRLRGAYPFRKL